MSKKTWEYRVLNADPRILYAIVLILLVAVFVHPLGLPVPINANTQVFYDFIQNLPPGSVIFFCPDFDTSVWSANIPECVAVMNQIFSRPLKVVGFSVYPDGALGWQRIMELVDPATKAAKTYGVDYVFLGYLAGMESGMMQAASNLWTAFSVDFYGTQLTALPLMASVHNYQDASCLISAEKGTETKSSLLRVWAITYPTKLLFITHTTTGPVAEYGAGLIKAWIGGIGNSAEYEDLVHHPGAGIVLLDAQSIYLLVTLASLILGNAAYFSSKAKTKKEMKEVVK